MTMRAFIRSDLVRNFLGGFVLGVVGLVTLLPSAQAEALKDNISSVVRL